MTYSNHIIRLDKYAWASIALISILLPSYIVGVAILEGREMSSFETCYWIGYNISITFITALLIQIANVSYIHYLECKYPWRSRLKTRLFLEIIGVLIYTELIAIAVELLFYGVRFHYHRNFLVDIFKATVYALVLNIIFLSIYEAIYVFLQWKKALIEAEKLQKEHILFQYETLRSQVNPHFLFNSLNTLMAVVQKDPQQAVEFIKEFAKIYRNILDCKDKLVISLAEELALVRSFIYLQKIRFGNNLSIEYNISPEKLAFLVPPFSLQLLLENAIKHNIVSNKRPLHISIHDIGNYLIVSNNLQRRKDEGNSIGIGLKNLQTRYELISENTPEFLVTDNEYIAKIPLIVD
jgi:sensor histidine kinase YesM